MPRKGESHTEKGRKAIAEFQRQRVRSPEEKAKISRAASNRTPEHKAKIKASRVAKGSYRKIGDTYTDKSGYIWVKAFDDRGKRNWVSQHRMIVEQCTGRRLTSSEHVHHLDGDPSNNEPSNLVVLGRRQHGIINLMQKIADSLPDEIFDIATTTLVRRRARQRRSGQ